MIVQDVQFQETAVKQPQELGLADIDPEKLSSKLEKLFPTDPVEVYVSIFSQARATCSYKSTNKGLQVKHNAYSIQAPRPLSHVSLIPQLGCQRASLSTGLVVKGYGSRC
jgi:hypothetical protein